MPKITVSSRGQVVIPKEIRERHGITKGMQFEILDLEDQIVLVPVPEDPVAALRGMFKSDKTIKEMRAWVKEEDREREGTLKSFAK